MRISVGISVIIERNKGKRGAILLSQLRKNSFTGEWTIIAVERDSRPYQFGDGADGQPCPFCPGNEEMTPNETYRIENKGKWTVRVVPNKFPALCESKEDANKYENNVYWACEGYGRHEIVIETPLHDKGLEKLDVESIFNVFSVYRERIKVLSRIPEVECVQIFKNHGRNAGASLPHSHTQIVAMPYIPLRLLDSLKTSKEYTDNRGTCVYCDVVEEEVNNGERILFQNEHFISMVAFAPRFENQVLLIPKNHISDFREADDNVLFAFSRIYKQTIMAMTKLLGEFPYNFVLYSSPHGIDTPYYHWHMEIMPRLSYHAGFEIATASYMSTVSPEETAKKLRHIIDEQNDLA